MEFPWRNWCGFCGRIPKGSVADEKEFKDLRQQEILLELARKCFSISTSKNMPFPVCPDCEEFMESLFRFSSACANTKSLLLHLRRKKIRDEEEIDRNRIEYLLHKNDFCVKEEHSIQDTAVVDDNGSMGPGMVVIVKEEETDMIIEESSDVETNLADEIVETEEYNNQAPGPETPPKPIPNYAIWGITEDNKPMITDRRRRPQKRPPRPKNEEDVFKCKECGKKFWTEETFKLHENKHKPYNDPTKYRPYVCDICGKSVLTEISLFEHRSVHSDARPFKCTHCPKAYKTPQQFNVHLKTHSTEKHVCPECGQLFTTRKTYNRHKLVHSDVRKHVCVLCGDKFKRAVALKDHLMSHMGMKPYKCPFCEQCFQHGVNLRQHRSKFHPVELAALEASGKMEQVWIENRSLPKYAEILAMAEEKAIKDGIITVPAKEENNEYGCSVE